MRYSINGVHSEIDSLPGCTQIAVSHAVFMQKHLRSLGEGTRIGKLRDQHLQGSLGYDYCICTVASDNISEKKFLAHREYKLLDKFMSSKTDHAVEIWGKVLNETGQRVEPI